MIPDFFVYILFLWLAMAAISIIFCALAPTLIAFARGNKALKLTVASASLLTLWPMSYLVIAALCGLPPFDFFESGPTLLDLTFPYFRHATVGVWLVLLVLSVFWPVENKGPSAIELSSSQNGGVARLYPRPRRNE